MALSQIDHCEELLGAAAVVRTQVIQVERFESGSSFRVVLSVQLFERFVQTPAGIQIRARARVTLVLLGRRALRWLRARWRESTEEDREPEPCEGFDESTGHAHDCNWKVSFTCTPRRSTATPSSTIGLYFQCETAVSAASSKTPLGCASTTFASFTLPAALIVNWITTQPSMPRL